MFDEGLKTSLWVAAEIRRCEGLCLPMTVEQRGDSDRGLVAIKQYVYGQGCRIYTQRRKEDGGMGWHSPLGEAYIPEFEANDYLSRQRQYDEDLWVLEVDDPKEIYQIIT